MRKPLIWLSSATLICSLHSPALADACPGSGFRLANGTTADADKVMDWLDCKSPSDSPSFTGNVGIGTATPSSLLGLSVANSSNVDEGILIDRASGASTFGMKLKSDSLGYYRGALIVKGNGGSTLEALSVTADGANSGFIGIGKINPAQILDVNGIIRQSGCANMPLSANASGDIVCTVSAARRQIIHGPFKDGLDALSHIAPITFTYKPTRSDPNETFIHAGFVAQDVARVIPEATNLQRDGYYALDAMPILAASVNAIHQLKSENDRLAARLATLEARLGKIEQRNLPPTAQ